MVVPQFNSEMAGSFSQGSCVSRLCVLAKTSCLAFSTTFFSRCSAHGSLPTTALPKRAGLAPDSREFLRQRSVLPSVSGVGVFVTVLQQPRNLCLSSVQPNTFYGHARLSGYDTTFLKAAFGVSGRLCHCALIYDGRFVLPLAADRILVLFPNKQGRSLREYSSQIFDRFVQQASMPS